MLFRSNQCVVIISRPLIVLTNVVLGQDALTKEYRCHVLGCDYDARCIFYVEDHMRTSHVWDSEKSYACKGCGQRFADPKEVKEVRHQRECSNVGGDARPIQCMREPWERAENAGLLKPEWHADLLPAPHDLNLLTVLPVHLLDVFT